MNATKFPLTIALTAALLGTVTHAYTQTLAAKPAPIAATAPTAVPALIPHTGIATAENGKVLAGEIVATFLIFKDEQGGQPLFTESQTVVVDSTGHYTVNLGASLPSGLPSDLFASGEARWLEVQIAGEPAQARILLTSVPYALKSGDASTLGGLPASAFVLAGARTSTNASPAVQAAVITPDTTSNVTTTGGTSGYLPVFTGASTVADSILYSTTTGLGIGDVPGSGYALDVKGKSIWRGLLDVANAGTATTSTGYASYPLLFQSSAYNTSSKAALLPAFELQAEPTGNNTATTGGTFNLLYSSNSGTPAETGLHFNSNGTINFASGQTFPGTGAGTITGVTAGTGLTGGGTSGKVTLGVNTAVVPTLAGNNTYTGTNIFKPSLYTDTDMNIDNTNANQGSISPGLRFGEASGEGIASQRGTSGDNQYGLDFYTDYARRMSISEAGAVSISSAGGPTALTVTNESGQAAYLESDSQTSLYVRQNSTNTQTYILDAEGATGYCQINTSGNLECSGSISEFVSDVKMDHPLDPANKYLVHASVESSEMMNIYTGNAITDDSGLATVTLPDWFEAENGDFRYQLTVVGERFAQAIVSKRIANHQFTIHTNASNIPVSWQVTGVRQDAYAKAHPLVVEQEKPAKEQGLYAHPEVFGQPKEKSISWARNPKRLLASKAANK